MCGICGFTGEIQQKENVIRKMTEVITHRGPDSDGFTKMTIYQWVFAAFLSLILIRETSR